MDKIYKEVKKIISLIYSKEMNEIQNNNDDFNISLSDIALYVYLDYL